MGRSFSVVAVAALFTACPVPTPHQFRVDYTDAGCVEYTLDGGGPTACDLLTDCDEFACATDGDCTSRSSCAELLGCALPRRGELCIGQVCIGVYEHVDVTPCGSGCPAGTTCDRGYCVVDAGPGCIVDAGPAVDAGADAG